MPLLTTVFLFAFVVCSSPVDSCENVTDSSPVVPKVLHASNFTSTVDAGSVVVVVPEACESDSCRQIAKNLLNSMDQTVDPCEDFYQFSCGNWIRQNVIPDNETEVGLFKKLQDDMKPKIQGLLASAKPAVFRSENQSKAFFKQCIDQEEVDRLGPKPLLDLLNDLLGGWPIISADWDPADFDLLATLQKLYMYSYQPLFTFAVGPDLAAPTDNMIFFDEPSTYTSVDVLLSEAGTAYTASYRTYLLNVTVLLKRDLGDFGSVDQFAKDLDEIVAFERDLSLAGQNAVDGRDLMQMKDKSTFPEIYRTFFNQSSLAENFQELTRNIFGLVNMTDQINDTTQVVVKSKKFFSALDKLLAEVEMMPDGRRRLANFFGWTIISGNVGYLPKRYRDAEAEHTQRVNGQAKSKDKPAAERCAGDASAVFPLAVGAMYIRDFVPVDLKPKASMIVQDLRFGLKDLLTEASWMDNVTFSKAVTKLDDMIDFIGYADILVNSMTAVDDDYQTVEIKSTYFATVQEVGRYQIVKNLRKLNKKNLRNDPIEDQTDITTVNAYNYLGKNLIVILAALMQSPFFDADAPFYLNYGGMGFVLGHEMTHGFDDQGSSFDGEGNMVSWWTTQTKDTYDIRKRGLVAQYSNYSLPTGKVNGELTLGENIADNGGLKAAYRAYLKFRQRLTTPEPILPGMDGFTSKKLFFVAAAQVWCSAVRPKAEMLKLLTDEHSPTRYRVIGPMSNMHEFAEAFRCPVGSTMNPKEKFAVW